MLATLNICEFQRKAAIDVREVSDGAMYGIPPVY